MIYHNMKRIKLTSLLKEISSLKEADTYRQVISDINETWDSPQTVENDLYTFLENTFDSEGPEGLKSILNAIGKAVNKAKPLMLKERLREDNAPSYQSSALGGSYEDVVIVVDNGDTSKLIDTVEGLNVGGNTPLTIDVLGDHKTYGENNLKSMVDFQASIEGEDSAVIADYKKNAVARASKLSPEDKEKLPGRGTLIFTDAITKNGIKFDVYKKY
jgi:hypothetical protein